MRVHAERERERLNTVTCVTLHYSHHFVVKPKIILLNRNNFTLCTHIIYFIYESVIYHNNNNCVSTNYMATSNTFTTTTTATITTITEFFRVPSASSYQLITNSRTLVLPLSV